MGSKSNGTELLRDKVNKDNEKRLTWTNDNSIQ